MSKRSNLKPAEWKLIARVRELSHKQYDGRSRMILVQKVGEKFEVGTYAPHGILDNSPLDERMAEYFDIE